MDSIPEFSLSSISAALQETRAQQQNTTSATGNHGNLSSGQTSFYSQWGSGDQYSSESPYNFYESGFSSHSKSGTEQSSNALTFDFDIDPLNQSTTSDKFGLNNSSTSSTGLHLADMVTKIVDEDACHKFGLGGNNMDLGHLDSHSKSRTNSDVFSYDGLVYSVFY